MWNGAASAAGNRATWCFSSRPARSNGDIRYLTPDNSGRRFGWPDRLVDQFLSGGAWGLKSNLLPPRKLPSSGVGDGCGPSSCSALSSTGFGLSPTWTKTLSGPVFGGPVTVCASIPEWVRASLSASADVLVMSLRSIRLRNSSNGGADGISREGVTSMPARSECLAGPPETFHLAVSSTKLICLAVSRDSPSSTYSMTAVIPINLDNATIAPDWSLKFLGSRLTANAMRLRFSSSSFSAAARLSLRSSSEARTSSACTFLASAASFSSVAARSFALPASAFASPAALCAVPALAFASPACLLASPARSFASATFFACALLMRSEYLLIPPLANKATAVQKTAAKVVAMYSFPKKSSQPSSPTGNNIFLFGGCLMLVGVILFGGDKSQNCKV